MAFTRLSPDRPQHTKPITMPRINQALAQTQAFEFITLLTQKCTSHLQSLFCTLTMMLVIPRFQPKFHKSTEMGQLGGRRYEISGFLQVPAILFTCKINTEAIYIYSKRNPSKQISPSRPTSSPTFPSPRAMKESDNTLYHHSQLPKCLSSSPLPSLQTQPCLLLIQYPAGSKKWELAIKSFSMKLCFTSYHICVGIKITC